MRLSSLVIFVFTLTCITCSESVDIFSPSVFNFYFYINTNYDLNEAHLFTLEQAQNHWKTFGIHEGRQACGSFHSVQYLERYPNLKQKFGSNYSAAIDHYLTIGLAQGLLGYVEGGYDGRYTIHNPKSGIFMSASDRMGGAVDSVVWNNYEFINAWDHGRELQSAVTNGHGECFNPTEAGSGIDLHNPTTTTVIQNITAVQNELQTRVLPAFWMVPGEPHSNPTSTCSKALNKVKVSNYTMSKKVTIGFSGIDNAISFLSSVFVPQDDNILQVEAPTGYMSKGFDHFYSINVTTGDLTPLPTTTGEIPFPLVFSTADSTHAMGAWSPGLPSPEYPSAGYGKFHFHFANDPNSTNKWTLVHRNKNVKAGTTMHYNAYICVGTLQQVSTCMTRVHSKFE